MLVLRSAVASSCRALVVGSNRSSHRNVVKNSASRSSSALIGLFRDAAPRRREIYYASYHHGENPFLENAVPKTCSSPITRTRWMSTSSSSSSDSESKSGGSSREEEANANSSGAVDQVEVADDDNNNNNNDKDKNDDEEDDAVLVYESPLAYNVKRLRVVALVSAASGTLGLPLLISLKGGIAALPPMGSTIATMFCALSTTSAAVITYCFSPYVYTIHRIPVRKCHYKKKKKEKKTMEDENNNDEAITITTTACDDDDEKLVVSKKKKIDHYLLKALTQTVFLTPAETVFDAEKDVVPYDGHRPLCNFHAKGRPLYVHTDGGVRDETLLRKIIVPPTAAGDTTKKKKKNRYAKKKNPDDEFL